MTIIALILAGKEIIRIMLFILKPSEFDADTGFDVLEECIEQEPEDETLDMLDEEDFENELVDEALDAVEPDCITVEEPDTSLPSMSNDVPVIALIEMSRWFFSYCNLRLQY